MSSPIRDTIRIFDALAEDLNTFDLNAIETVLRYFGEGLTDESLERCTTALQKVAASRKGNGKPEAFKVAPTPGPNGEGV